MSAQETVIVIGAGIGGLCTAMMLAPTGRKVIVLERDGEMPSGDLDTIFREWRRPGVGHLRQSHAFLARLRTIMKRAHPGLLDQLRALGVRELTFDGMLTPKQRKTYRPAPLDEELTFVTSRRTTLELALRAYAESLPGVTIRWSSPVKRLVTNTGHDGCVDVTGVVMDENGQENALSADVIIDASGKSGFLIEQLMENGASIREESETAGILYFTRHYRINEGRDEPKREGNPPATGDLGYIKFGVFPGDNGNFSITLAVPEIEYELRKAVFDPEIFHAITMELPGLRVWTNAEQATPTSKVYGMGDLHSRWRDLVTLEKKPAVRGYLALGDTLVRTNPLYGRGCSFAAVSAEIVARVLDQHQDPDARLLAYHQAIFEELRPFYLTQRRQDRTAIKRARHALTPGYKQSFRSKVLQSFVEDGVQVAVRSDTRLLRAAMRGFHMLEHPEKWLTRPQNLSRVLYYWARGKKRNAEAYPPKAGPKREVMMRALQIDFEADIKRAAQELKVAA